MTINIIDTTLITWWIDFLIIIIIIIILRLKVDTNRYTKIYSSI